MSNYKIEVSKYSKSIVQFKKEGGEEGAYMNPQPFRLLKKR